MRFRFVSLVFLSWIFLCFASVEASPSRIPPLPNDFSKVDVYLATRDIGHQVQEKYGHTIVRVVDHEHDFDIGYNWGTFDFEEPGYFPRFLKGILIYEMSFGAWRSDVRDSKDQMQTMWLERVNFTTKQKETLLRRIHWQAQPENVKYPYFFFYDNCSTRVRDYFDEALGGKIKARTFDRKIGQTYRDRVMQHNASVPMFALGQDVILSSEPDRVMSEWDDMFIPIQLRHYLLSMPAFDDNGQEIPGSKLLSDTKVLTKFPQPDVPFMNGYGFFWLLAGVPAALGVVLVRSPTRNRSGIRLIGFANIVVGAVWGFFGLFMALSWAFSGHTVLPHNANLWLMWPTDWLYLVLGANILWTGSLGSLSPRVRRVMFWYTLLHAVGMVLLAVAGLGHFIQQDVGRVVVWFIPLAGLVWCSLIVVLRRK